MTAQTKVTGSSDMLNSDDERLTGSMTHAPGVDRIVRKILNESPHRSASSSEDVAADASIENLKRWCDGF
jgi:hypothetical protein